MNIKEIKKQRFQFLQRVYELTNGSTNKEVNSLHVGSELGIDEFATIDITQYLIDENLLETQGFGDGQHITITHDGIIEVEEALENPDKPTEHFPAVSIINVQTMTNSVIQQNSNGATQNINIKSEEKTDIKEFLDELKKSLNSLNLAVEEQNEILAEINTVNIQIESPKPKTIIINESLKTIRSILESVAANAYTPILLEKLGVFMSGFSG